MGAAFFLNKLINGQVLQKPNKRFYIKPLILSIPIFTLNQLHDDLFILLQIFLLAHPDQIDLRKMLIVLVEIIFIVDLWGGILIEDLSDEKIVLL